MNIIKEDTGKLTASLKVVVTREDYEEKVIKALKDYQRKTSMPGFRPGKVPFGLVSKMYRKGVMLDEINHLISDNLNQYIETNQLRLIGNPLPNKEKSATIDLDEQSDFEFTFDIGFAPDLQLDLNQMDEIDMLKIKAGERMVDESVMDLRKRLSKNADPGGQQEPLDQDHELPALDTDFFSQVFPGQNIVDENSFREKIRESIEHSLVKESERYFLNSAIERLVMDTNVEMPEDFIRKLIEENDTQDQSGENREKQFENFIRSMKWQLIESQIIRDHNLVVQEEEMRNVVKSYFTGQVPKDEENPEHADKLNQIVDSVLNNEQESSRLHDQLFEQKLLNFFKEKLKINHKDIDYDEFVKLVTQKRS